ncbi:MAG: hypothetical protein ALECFALPRED_007271 [Alectoria fallacina]|uniref:C3H1-type domain-containing protein n=1 Tax=Alectoria fallacina TaxID=1903189 RepID=A0A8H3GCL5_9LECA|nr:MAG: hypothetical protein ALECFALPRED_007271 [Alectoria fallacina]
MASASIVPGANSKLVMKNKTYVSVLIDGNTLKFGEDFVADSYHGGVRAANELRTLIADRLSNSSIETGEHLDVLIQIYANGESLASQSPDGKESETKLTDFYRGYNTHRPLSSFEDTRKGGPSGAGPLITSQLLDILDNFLRQIKDSSCVKVVVVKPCGPGFQAMIRAQRQNGTLPAKLIEIVVHPPAVQTTQTPYPFMAIASLEASMKATQNTSTQNISTQNTSTQNTSTQNTSTQNTSNKVDSAQVGVSQAFTTAADPNAMVPRNSRGQRVDPRPDALTWLIIAARKQKICYEYHLHGSCTWGPEPCPNRHMASRLSVHQLNALQVLARELPCNDGNACQNWACCFGHRCPFGARCNKGSICRFSREMHVTDLKVVRHEKSPNIPP